MKKILVTTLLSVVAAGAVMAQGRVNFNNTGVTPIRISDGGELTLILGTASVGTFGIGPASAQIRLYAGLTSSSLAPVLIGTAADQEFVPNTANTALAAVQGTFAGGSNLALAGYDGSAPVFLQFTASATGAAGQWAGVPFFGESPIIQVNLATGLGTATTLFGTGPNQWDGLTMTPVPEPSSMALAGLGAASLLFFRRRK